MQLMPSSWGAKALVKQTPWVQWERPWWSATKLQGRLADKRDKGVVSITTKFIPQQWLLLQECQSPQCKHDECKQEAPRTGSLGQIRQIHASDLLQWECWGQQQNLQKRTCKFQQKRNCHDTLATRQAHDTHSTNTKGKLTGSTRDTVPRQQNKCEWWWQQQQVPCYFGGIPKIRVVIGYSSGGIFIPAKWCDSLKANCWSNQWQKLVIQSYSHSNRLMATSSKYVYTQRSMGNS